MLSLRFRALSTLQQVLDVFIVVDESASVNETNYLTAIEFIRNFVQDLDNSVRPAVACTLSSALYSNAWLAARLCRVLYQKFSFSDTNFEELTRNTCRPRLVVR